MDALSHNLEAYCAPGYHPMAEGIALEGMRLIKQWLPVAYHEPGNLEARSHMLIASSMGATAFQKGLGAMHALAHPLGAIYDAHHGLLNAILMPYVLAYNCAYNRESIEGKMQHLSRVLGLTSASVNAVLDFIMALRKSIDIPNDLQSIGIGLEHVPKIAKMATQDPSAAGNPVLLTEENYAELLTNAINGRLHG